MIKTLRLVLMCLVALLASACGGGGGGSNDTGLAVPAMDNAANQVYTEKTTIATLTFNNNGGGSLTACIADTLPTGLNLAISSDTNSCELTGTPTSPQVATVHTITATNASGSDTATVSIGITGIAPLLDDAAAQVYTEQQVISGLIFNNAGGGSLSSCTADTLPTGLNIAVTGDGNSCKISGTPSILQAATTHTITATNPTGSDTATVSISVVREAALLTLAFEQIKTFRFSWNAPANVNHYTLFENPDGSSGFSQLSQFDALTVNFAHIVALYSRVNAQYLLQTCYSADESDCVDSNIISVSGTLADSIGYIKASNSEADDNFGIVDISGDGNTMVIGSLTEDSNAIGIDGDQANNLSANSGAVYVFSFDGATWTQQAYIKASNTGPGDFFGVAVGLNFDGNTLAVGAFNEDSNATGIDGDQTDNSLTNSGAVYVFTRSGTTWTQQQYIKASNPGSGDIFGQPVKLSDDGNTLAVGAQREGSNATGINGIETDNSAEASGAIYVFSRSGSTWSQQAYIKASNTDAFDGFATAIGMSSDGNTLAVSAHNEGSNATGMNGAETDNSAAGSGAVYVFSRIGSTWSQQAYIKSSNSEADDRFGYFAVDLSNDGNTLAVGAFREDGGTQGVGGDQSSNGNINSGAAYVFIRSGVSWSQQAYIKASNTEINDEFGRSIALSDDGNTLAVASTKEQSDATGINGSQGDNLNAAGAVYLYVRNGGTWSQQSYIKASNTGGNDSFGTIIALSGDGQTLAVRAHREASNATGISGDQTDNSAEFSGAVYLY